MRVSTQSVYRVILEYIRYLYSTVGYFLKVRYCGQEN